MQLLEVCLCYPWTLCIYNATECHYSQRSLNVFDRYKESLIDDICCLNFALECKTTLR